ncbi:MAG: c-type cytochrome [Vicinamibacterales bacterium]
MALSLKNGVASAIGVLGFAALTAGAAHAGGAQDVKNGQNVFDSSCGNCHTVKEGKHKSGPSLFGVVGRTAGSVDGFVYSDAMKGSGIVWTAEKLDAFAANPKGLVEQTKMKFGGVKNDKSRADLLAYLAEQK